MVDPTHLSHVFVSQPSRLHGPIEYGHVRRNGAMSALVSDYHLALTQARAHWPDLINDVGFNRPYGPRSNPTACTYPKT